MMDIHELKLKKVDLSITPEAAGQILLLQKNDYTLADCYPRLIIKGKGCNGFDYAVSFSKMTNEDIKISCDYGITIIMDAFTAKFVKSGVLDFIQDHQNEGFHFKNHDENLFHGKFYKDLEFENI